MKVKMKKIIFSTFLIVAPLFAELEIVDSIPLGDMSDLAVQHASIDDAPAPAPAESTSGKWVNGLGDINNNVVTKKTYLKGILNGQDYGKYTPSKLVSSALVGQLYKKRNYETFWITSDFDVNNNLFEMVDMIKHSGNEGLESEKYHLADISAILDEIKNDVTLSDKDKNLAIAQVDVLLSDAFFTMAKDLREGEVSYREFKRALEQKSKHDDVKYGWEDPQREINYLSLLDRVSTTGELKKQLLALSAPNSMYIQLKDAYQRYKDIATQGGWKKIPRGKKLRMGNISKTRVPLMAERLSMTGDLDYYDPDITVVTPEMKEAIKHYQRRMGIWPSGVLTDATRNALNVSVEKRLAKIKLNLDRMRWEKEDFGNEYVFVNIPDFRMQFIRDGLKDVDMRVVVGKKKNPTPIFTATFSYMVLNPTWSVPKSIVKKEMLPRIQEDPDYLATRNFKLYKGWDKNRKEIDGFDVDWWQYDEESNLPFSFVRKAGPGNPLGDVKFVFPNKYAVYMHDTPQKKLFKNARRAYSHGCIRLYKPKELLEYMSNNYCQTPYNIVKSMQKSGETQSLRLDYGLPVYIRYYTAWVDNSTGVNFRNDIYGYDKIQSKLLN